MNSHRIKYYLGLIVIVLFSIPNLILADIKFIPNKGQWDSQALVRAEIPGGKFWLSKTGFTFHFKDNKGISDYIHGKSKKDSFEYYIFNVEFLNCNNNLKIIQEDLSKEYYNFLLGTDPSHWKSKIRASKKITVPNVWKGIDLVLEGHNGFLKYNFLVHKGANFKDIKLKYPNKNRLKIKNGDFIISTPFEELREQNPISFQDGVSNKKEIRTEFKLNGNLLSFNVEDFDKSKDLLIDPTLIFATFSGSDADNFGFTATYDSYGNGYSGGTAYGDGFPASKGEVQGFITSFQGGIANTPGFDNGIDAAILKYSPDGKRLIWASYLGGSGNDHPHSMVVDQKNDLLVMGTTNSQKFPGAIMGGFGGYDLYVSRISQDGSKIINSIVIGGSNDDGINGSKPYSRNSIDPLVKNYGDPFRGEIINDSNGKVWICSSTRSSDIKLINPWKKSLGGNQDVYLAELSEDISKIEFATFFGGTKDDAGYGINFDRNGSMFACGGTMGNFTDNFTGILKNSFNDAEDGFLIKIGQTDFKLKAFSFVGTNQYDQTYFVQVDNIGRVYTTGQSLGDFPITGNVYSNAGAKQFIATYDNNLEKLLFSTVFGNSKNKNISLSPSAFLVDLCGRICFSGWGGGANLDFSRGNGNTFSLPTSVDAFQSKTDGSDFYLAVFSPELTKLTYSTYYGGRKSEEHVDGGTSRFDREGKIYQSICGGCGGFSDMPTTDSAWSRTNNGLRPWDKREGGCNNAFFKMDLNSSNFAPKFADTIITTFANEVFKFTFSGTDQDKFDSIIINAKSEIFNKSGIKNPAVIAINNGIGTSTGTIIWKPSCIDIDTFIVNVKMRDNGCPIPRKINRTIKIVVIPPPPPKPPGVFCFKRIDQNTIQVTWDELEAFEGVKEFYLFKQFPDSSLKKLLTFNNSSKKFFIDNQAFNHLTTDYKYFIYGTNICGTGGDSTRKLSTIPKKDSIPEPLYMNVVSVEKDSFISVKWNRNIRPDFYSYTLFKKENLTNAAWSLVYSSKLREDTSFKDIAVEVFKKSYIYKVFTNTQCKVSSVASNFGTSILLKGNAVPFENNLFWNSYTKWQGGVRQYIIFRQDTTDKYFLLDSTSSITYKDDRLNPNWGLYHYKVLGIEGDSGKGAVSLSNSIYLYQAPILYVPNAFTPTGDGLNDIFNYDPLFVKDLEVKVFNRWGELVFASKSKYQRWDGTYKGNKNFNNVYIWQVKYTGFNGEEFYKFGNVSTIR